MSKLGSIFEMTPEKRKEMHTCIGCGLFHDRVECAGIHHCPNPYCHGSGGAYFRTQLKSYKDVPGTSQHTVDELEWREVALKALEADPLLSLDIQAMCEERCNPYIGTYPSAASLSTREREGT